MNTKLNVNNLMEIRKIGLQALREALGPVGMVRFIQQYENGYGDYTKEKYQQQDITVDEIDILLKTQENQTDFKGAL